MCLWCRCCRLTCCRSLRRQVGGRSPLRAHHINTSGCVVRPRVLSSPCTDLLTCWRLPCRLCGTLPGVEGLLPYMALCDKLHLPHLRAGLEAHCSQQAVWRQLQQPEHARTLEHMRRRYSELWAAVMRRMQGADR